MSGVIDYLSRFFRGFAFWIVVLPWQQALRVRAGRYVRLLEQGIYLKIPILDVVRLESVTRRTSLVPVQTLSTSDGATVILSAVVGYSIGDIRKLYSGLHHAEDTIIQTAQGILTSYGLTNVTLHITDFAFMRAIRLIQDQERWFNGRVLDTQGAVDGDNGR